MRGGSVLDVFRTVVRFRAKQSVATVLHEDSGGFGQLHLQKYHLSP
jgi:hypothetical protein